jgi:hypothetical protein
MPAPERKNLRTQVSMAMRNCDFEDACAAYCGLEVHEADNRTRSQRKSKIFEQQQIADQAVASALATPKYGFPAPSRKHLPPLTENNPRPEAVIRRISTTRKHQNASRKQAPLGQGRNGGFIL